MNVKRWGCVSLAVAMLASCGTGDDPAGPATNAQSASTPRYSCGGSGTFSAADIAAERRPDDDILEGIERLRQTMDGEMLPADGWFVVVEGNRRTDLLAPLRDHFAEATFEKEEGRWKPVGWGECSPPRLRIEDKSVLRWAFEPGSYPPDPKAKKLSILVSEVECSSSRKLDGLIQPEVTYTDSTIEVILTAPALRGGHCGAPAPTRYDLELEQPVGDRNVIDLSVYPAAEPTPGTSLP
jgi:hypothetical protein